MRIGGRVTSIQIEDAFWRLLKRQAAENGENLSALLARLRRETPTGTNFTSALRLACLADVERRLGALQAELAVLQTAGASGDAPALLALLPGPALMLGRDRTILARSAGFLDWIGVPPEAVDGRPLDVLVARGARGTLDALWRRAQAAPVPIGGIVNLVVAGRIRIARLTLRATAGGGAFVLF